MLQTITPEICSKLGEIGFEKDEINTIQIIHELKTRAYSIDIKKLINKAAFENLSKGISGTFEKTDGAKRIFLKLLKRSGMKRINETRC